MSVRISVRVEGCNAYAFCFAVAFYLFVVSGKIICSMEYSGILLNFCLSLTFKFQINVYI